MTKDLTANAAAFLTANARHPVVAGQVRGQGGQGAFYRLSNGREYDLTANECEVVAPIKWKVPK